VRETDNLQCLGDRALQFFASAVAPRHQVALAQTTLVAGAHTLVKSSMFFLDFGRQSKSLKWEYLDSV
jgi:hypothetical protein